CFGAYWNAVVATSLPVARCIRRQLPWLESRLATIPHGSSIPAALVEKVPTATGALGVLIIGADQTCHEGACWVEALTRTLATADGVFQTVVVDPPSSLRDMLVAI